MTEDGSDPEDESAPESASPGDVDSAPEEGAVDEAPSPEGEASNREAGEADADTDPVSGPGDRATSADRRESSRKRDEGAGPSRGGPGRERGEEPERTDELDDAQRGRAPREEREASEDDLGPDPSPSDGPEENPAAVEEGADAAAGGPQGPEAAAAVEGVEDEASEDIPEDVQSYDRFQKMDRAGYDRVNEFLRDRTYITAREWAIARLCADFRTATGVEMTKIGQHLPELVPFMTDTYSPQAVNQARSAFEDKVRMAGATFLYGAMSGFFTADELDDLMYEVTEVAKFLLEVEGVELAVEEELAAEDRISSVMREVREASEQLRYDDVECPECGHHIRHPEAEPE